MERSGIGANLSKEAGRFAYFCAYGTPSRMIREDAVAKYVLRARAPARARARSDLFAPNRWND